MISFKSVTLAIISIAGQANDYFMKVDYLCNEIRFLRIQGCTYKYKNQLYCYRSHLHDKVTFHIRPHLNYKKYNNGIHQTFNPTLKGGGVYQLCTCKSRKNEYVAYALVFNFYRSTAAYFDSFVTHENIQCRVVGVVGVVQVWQEYDFHTSMEREKLQLNFCDCVYSVPN